MRIKLDIRHILYVLAVVIAGFFSCAYAHASGDSVSVPVKRTVATDYKDMISKPYPSDLRTPENIKTQAEYDAQTGLYVIRTKVGDMDIVTPFTLTPAQYRLWQNDISMRQRWRELDKQTAEGKNKDPFNVLDMNFALGPLERIFGPGGLR
ncbi:MAG: hypothetical protein K2K08_06825, partial [Paramuribaculum sp.]|nr:hypothetical protein [Paramuribaculum sp.]